MRTIEPIPEEEFTRAGVRHLANYPVWWSIKEADGRLIVEYGKLSRKGMIWNGVFWLALVSAWLGGAAYFNLRSDMAATPLIAWGVGIGAVLIYNACSTPARLEVEANACVLSFGKQRLRIENIECIVVFNCRAGEGNSELAISVVTEGCRSYYPVVQCSTHGSLDALAAQVAQKIGVKAEVCEIENG